MGEISLHGEWFATWADGLHGKARHAAVQVKDPERYLSFLFPGSIQSNLIEAGVIEDPRININSLKARWVEEHFWILRKKFIVPPEAIDQDPKLFIEVLDGVAQVLVNGIKVGEHSNSHRPLDIELKLALKPGENELTVLLESGLYKVADLPGAQYSITDETILNKRHHLRQPQYQFGWDWNPRLIYFGLHGDIRIYWGEIPRLSQVSVIGTVSDDLRIGKLAITPSWFVPGDENQIIQIAVYCEGDLWYENEFDLPPGETENQLTISRPDPKLWWPRGYGEQNLIKLDLQISQKGVLIDRHSLKTGFRKVELSQPPHPEEGFYFQLKINNQPVFCKGANWVPPEMSAFEVSTEKLQRLVDLAVDQEFNMLRIWGGGVWAGHELLSMCDDAGIMVWHDLLFACSKYPADDPSFLRELQKEITWGLKEFSSYPSLVVWCGNNELEWGLWSWDYQDFGSVAPDYVLFHHVIPSLLMKIDSTRPYWPSSPYSSPDAAPNDPTRGDQHPWQVSIIDDKNPEDFWQYRKFIDRFPNEGGVLGISPDESLREFLLGNEYKIRSMAWEHHDNTVNFWLPRRGVGYLMVEDWFGTPYLDFSIDELAMASGLLQAEGLKEYIRNYRRRYPSTTSAIYWDYVDSWPSVHGWGTLDYFLRKKLSYYAVKRSNQPVITVLADESDSKDLPGKIGVFVVNETAQRQNLTLRISQFSTDQSVIHFEDQTIWVEPYSVKRSAEIAKSEGLVTIALLYTARGELIDWDRILFRKIKDLKIIKPSINVSVIEFNSHKFARYQANMWVWGVVIDQGEDGFTTDNAFDLFPGIPRDIMLGSRVEPYPIRETGSNLSLQKRQK